MSTNLQKPSKGHLWKIILILDFFLFSCVIHPVPRKNLPAWRDSFGSQDQLLYYPNPYLKLSQEQCASYILYMLCCPPTLTLHRGKYWMQTQKVRFHKKEIRFDKKRNQVWQKRKSGFTKKEIRLEKKGNQVWQKGLTRFASGAQVAENELACLFDREHFSEKTSYIVRPLISCRRMLSFLILIQLLKSSWSWYIEPWFQTIKGPLSRSRVYRIHM